MRGILIFLIAPILTSSIFGFLIGYCFQKWVLILVSIYAVMRTIYFIFFKPLSPGLLGGFGPSFDSIPFRIYIALTTALPLLISMWITNIWVPKRIFTFLIPIFSWLHKILLN